uniref:Pecanex-like protein n=1 Tax=Schistosoma curassoni TaxID=6186 RepID=A0A183KFN8_9TREM
LFFLYTIVDEISSAFASSSSSSTSSLSSLSNNNRNHHNNNLILATGSACPSNPGIACSHDYLSVDAPLLCVPINPPSGNGVVDYRFRVNQQTSHTFAYAEVFCPSDRWLEPMDPDLDEINPAQSSWSFSSTDNSSSPNNDNIPNPWWLQRRRHITLICDHHERKWIPNRLPEACLTSDELATFVAQITRNLQEIEKNTKLSLNSNQSNMNNSNDMMLKTSTSINQSQLNTTHSSLYLKAANNNDQVTHLSSDFVKFVDNELITSGIDSSSTIIENREAAESCFVHK